MSTKQVSMRLDDEIISKLKYVAWYERETITDVYTTLAEDRIKAFEAKNGPITAEQLSKLKK